MPFVENLDEFTERQACEFVDARSGWRIFENGAASDGQVHVDPPRHPHKMLQLRIQYLEVKLAETENLAHRVRGDYLARLDFYRLGSGPGPNPKMLDYLETLAAEIEELRAKLVPLQHEFFRPQRERQELADAEQRRRQELAEEATARLRSIPL